MKIHSDSECNHNCEYGLPCTGMGYTILGGMPAKVSPETEAIFAPLFDEIRRFKSELQTRNHTQKITGGIL